MTEFDPPGAVPWICRMLEEAGHETWAVGGAVRDALAGLPSGDWDLTTSARPDEVRRLFRRTVPIGVQHGTVGVLARDGTMYEVTTFRRDVETTGRHAVVAFAETLDEDLARRDFTINAVAWHPLRGVLRDPFGGADDLRKRVLRTVGEAADRFAEDYLRVLRALRFAGAFGLVVDPDTWRSLARAVPHMHILSPERVREEMDKVLGGPRPSSALGLYACSGALEFFYPELVALQRRGEIRASSAWTRNLLTVDLLSPRRPGLRWAALLAGIGTAPGTMGAGEEEEPPRRRGLLRAAALLRRLRSSNARIEEVAGLVEWVDEAPAPDAPDADLRRFLSGAGRERLSALLRIWAARARVDTAFGRQEGARSAFVERARRLRTIARSDVPLSVSELAVNGRDLIRAGHRPGAHFGDLLRHLLDRVLEEPGRNDREALLLVAEAWLEEGHDV
jgi:tRNA nucleotidyltransferase (CCA-adding enzyme)